MSDLVEIKKFKPNSHVIELLEELLEDAKEGIIVSVAASFVRHDAASGNCFTHGYPINLIGELLCLQREITDSCIDTRLHDAGKEY